MERILLVIDQLRAFGQIWVKCFERICQGK